MAITVEQAKTLGRWKPLIEIPEVIPSASFLEGYSVQDYLQLFNETADAQYGDAAGNIKTYDISNDVLVGSSPLANVHARETARKFMGPSDIRLATQADLERALRANALNFRGTYEDSALVLRSAGDRDWTNNDYVACDLAEQIKARDSKLGKLKTPVVIPLNGLDIRRESNSKYGLAFTLREDAEMFEAPILQRNGQFSSADVDAKTGLPTQLKGGNRTLYTRDNGLSRLCLYGDLVLYSDNRDLAGSDSYGRVVLVRGEAARAEFADKFAKDIAQKKSELESRYNAERTALDARYAEAIKVFEGDK